MNIKKYFKLDSYLFKIKEFLGLDHKVSYSQSGEDIIIATALRKMGVKRPVYIDIGANHPILLSNTYLFYKKGFKGICIEPDPTLFKKIKKKRKKDICLNIGIGTNSETKADFYIMSSNVLNTFSQKEAKYMSDNTSQKIEEIIKIPTKSLNNIIDEYYKNKFINFISLDTEGYDLDILKSINFDKIRPEVFCIETINYTEDATEIKNNEIMSFMRKKNYIIYGDTYINTIFVDKNKWVNRKK